MQHPHSSLDDSITGLASDKRQLAPTAALAEWIVRGAISPLPLSTTTWAKHALLDWFGVAIGGSADPLVDILVGDALEEGTHRAQPRASALACVFGYSQGAGGPHIRRHLRSPGHAGRGPMARW